MLLRSKKGEKRVRMQRLGPLDVRIAGGVDREGGGDGPLVVLLHGFGASGEDLVPLWRAIDAPSDVRWAFPAAPLELPSMGFGMESRAWWMIDVYALELAIRTGQQRDLSKQHPPGLTEAREMLLATLDAIDRTLAPKSLVLGGFSQGAMLALDTALHCDRALSGLVLMSGTLLDEDEWVSRMPARAGLPVLQSHGTIDPLLPFSLAERLRDHLRNAGLPVEFIEFRGGHEIPMPVLSEMGRFLSKPGA